MINGTIHPAAVAKAHQVIGSLCLESYHEANIKPDGTTYKKHRPYSVPVEAEEIIRCLNEDDPTSLSRIFIRRAHGIPGV